MAVHILPNGYKIVDIIRIGVTTNLPTTNACCTAIDFGAISQNNKTNADIAIVARPIAFSPYTFTIASVIIAVAKIELTVLPINMVVKNRVTFCCTA